MAKMALTELRKILARANDIVAEYDANRAAETATADEDRVREIAAPAAQDQPETAPSMGGASVGEDSAANLRGKRNGLKALPGPLSGFLDTVPNYSRIRK